MTCRIFFGVIVVLASSEVFSQPLILTGAERVDVLGRMSHLRDETGALTLNHVLGMGFSPLTPDESPNYGFDRATHWFKLEVANQSEIKDWFVDIPFSPLNQIDFYLEKDSSAGWVHKVAGDSFPIELRDIRYQNPVFAFSVLPGQTKTIYMRIKTTSSVQVPVVLWQRDAFFRHSFNIQIINGLFYGAMLLMTLYQLFLFISIRERVTLYYVLTLLAMTNVVAFFQGYLFLYLYPRTPWLNDVLAVLSGPIFILFSTLLTRSLLSLRENNRWLDDFLLTNMALDIIAGVLMLVFFGRISYEYHHYFILMHSAFALISAGYCVYYNYKPARYYLLSWITLLLATVVFTISNLGLAPGYLSTNYAGLMVGCILQMLFVAFALGERWNILTKENQKAKELELRRGQEEKVRLEQEVQLRTEEIQQKTMKLEEVNRVKDKLFSVVSHDIKGPIGSLQIALSLLKSGAITQEEFQGLASALETRFGQTTEFVENLLQWAALQLKGGSFAPAGFDLAKLASETIRLLEFECDQKGIEVKNDLRSPLNVYADKDMIRSVLRNLLMNAIKFTGKGGSVTLRAEQGDKYITILVSDTGVGIPAAHRGRLFTLESITTPGTKQEKGTGLGLLLCKEFVERNNGHIWFQTEEGKGTTFYFSLPEFVEEAASVPTVKPTLP